MSELQRTFGGSRAIFFGALLLAGLLCVRQALPQSNIHPTNKFAWGENIGWVNFDTRSKGTERARLDLVAQRFRGYAWGENVGWINLDDSTHFVEFGGLSGRQLPGDCNQDGDLDLSDAVCALGVLFTGNPPVFPCGDGSLTHFGIVFLIDWQPDWAVDLSDAIAALTFIFSGGSSHTLAILGMETSACVVMPGCPDNSNCP